MGREIKRVEAGFDWPLHQVWQGYKNPHADKSHDCPACEGTGYSVFARNLRDQWYGHEPIHPTNPFRWDESPIWDLATRYCKRRRSSPSRFEIAEEAQRLADLVNRRWMHHLSELDVAALVKANRLTEFTHTWTPETGWVPKYPIVLPSPTEVNQWSLDGWGHGAINCGVCVVAKCQRNGMPHLCDTCHGEAYLWESPEDQMAADAWTPTEPPAGDWWQLWETVSEGSPVSPAFAKPEQLAHWLAESQEAALIRKLDGVTTEAGWLRFILGDGWAPTLVSGPDGGCISGVQASILFAEDQQ